MALVGSTTTGGRSLAARLAPLLLRRLGNGLRGLQISGGDGQTRRVGHERGSRGSRGQLHDGRARRDDCEWVVIAGSRWLRGGFQRPGIGRENRPGSRVGRFRVLRGRKRFGRRRHRRRRGRGDDWLVADRRQGGRRPPRRVDFREWNRARRSPGSIATGLPGPARGRGSTPEIRRIDRDLGGIRLTLRQFSGIELRQRLASGGRAISPGSGVGWALGPILFRGARRTAGARSLELEASSDPMAGGSGFGPSSSEAGEVDGVTRLGLGESWDEVDAISSRSEIPDEPPCWCSHFASADGQLRLRESRTAGLQRRRTRVDRTGVFGGRQEVSRLTFGSSIFLGRRVDLLTVRDRPGPGRSGRCLLVAELPAPSAARLISTSVSAVWAQILPVNGPLASSPSAISQ